MSDFFDYDAISPWIPYLSEGLLYTLLIALFASIFGVAIGIVLTLMSRHKHLSKISYFYIDIFRGTPVILQLSMIYFALPALFESLINNTFNLEIEIMLSAFAAAIITFSLNSGAYISEIIRSGINGVSKGEIEAAKALGVSKYHIYKDIILPIAFINSFPALMNEFITLVKESSIVSIIGLQDLMRRQQIVTSQTYMYFEPLIVIGIIYYIVIKILTILGRSVEKRLQYD